MGLEWIERVKNNTSCCHFNGLIRADDGSPIAEINAYAFSMVTGFPCLRQCLLDEYVREIL